MAEPQQESQNSFEAEAEQAETGLIAEFWDFIKHNKKWWLTPIIIIVLLMAGVILLGPAAPFIYPMF
jgi:hypothetical protein